MTKSLKITLTIISGILIIVVLLSALPKSPESSKYHVDSINGNDNNDGQSPATAWESFGKVNSVVFKPGNSILFKANCSWTGQIVPQGSGNNEKQIVLEIYGYNSFPGNVQNKPHFEGNGVYTTVFLKDVEYWIHNIPLL